MTNEKPRKVIYSLWPIVILTPIIWFPQPSLLMGHPWKPELLLSLILGLIFVLGFGTEIFTTACQKVRPLVLPIVAFILFSGLSIFWASSANSAIHHTLVWAVYLCFFCLACRVVTDEKLLDYSLYGFGITLSIVAANCALEALLRTNIDQTFGFRYGRYAEIWATALPLFLSLALSQKGRPRVLAILAAILFWTALLFSGSRGSLAAGIVGLSIFGILHLFINRSRKNVKAIFAAAAVALVILVVTQLPALLSSTNSGSATLSRAVISSEDDDGNSIAGNVRFLFWNVGLEMFKSNPIIGIGADTYGLQFNNYRRILAADEANRDLVSKNEESMPERAHSEYIQILAELGVIGGALFFAFLIFAFYYCFRELRETRSLPENLVSHAALAGLIAFLMSSAYSSFSFRLVQNGIVFFFLLGLALRNTLRKRDTDSAAESGPVSYLPFVAASLCFALLLFSGLKATSQYLVYRAEHESADESKGAYLMAKALDGANASADFSYGMRLLGEKRYPEAAQEYESSIKKGVYTTAVYSYLISAHSLAEDQKAAIESARDAVAIFPYSVFLRTRYAVLLEDSGQLNEAAKNYALAESTAPRQALTWKLLIKDGAAKAAEAGRNGQGISRLADLYPQDGMYAMLAEREIRFPEEKFVFPTSQNR